MPGKEYSEGEYKRARGESVRKKKEWRDISLDQLWPSPSKVDVNCWSLSVWTPPGTRFKRSPRFRLLALDLAWTIGAGCGPVAASVPPHLAGSTMAEIEILRVPKVPVTSLWTLAVNLCCEPTCAPACLYLSVNSTDPTPHPPSLPQTPTFFQLMLPTSRAAATAQP